MSFMQAGHPGASIDICKDDTYMRASSNWRELLEKLFAHAGHLCVLCFS